MRVLHILDHSWPQYTGYTFRTGAIVAEQRRAGLETLHVTSSNQGPSSAESETARGLEFHRTPRSRLNRLPVLKHVGVVSTLRRRLRQLIRDLRPDVLHAHSPALDGVAALGLGVPLVYEVRAFWEDAAVEHGTTTAGSVRYRLTRALESHVLRRADAVVTICDGLRVEILARGIEASRVHVVPNAVDAAALPMIATRDEALARTLDLGEAIVVGYVGSFYAYEGLELLLRALPVLERSGRRTIAILGGGGPEDARLRALARELGVEHLCRFTGSIPHDQVARYYSLFDACVFPRTRSRLTDLVTPLKPLEAMAQGVLVLASDVGGHRELVSHGRTGLLFAPDSVDAIAGAVGALGQSTDHPEVRRRARAFVEGERTWAHVTRIYPALYERLVARSRTRLAVALDHGDSGRGSPGA